MKKIIIFIFCFVFLTSCKTIQYVEVPVVTHDTLIQKELQVDIIKDSIYYEVTQKGDTVFITKDKWHTEIKEIHDTLYISKNDTIPQPVYIEKEVKVTQNPWYEPILLIVFFISLFYFIIKLLNKYRIG